MPLCLSLDGFLTSLCLWSGLLLARPRPTVDEDGSVDDSIVMFDESDIVGKHALVQDLAAQILELNNQDPVVKYTLL